MRMLSIKPDIELFDTVKEFVENINLNENDLVITNKYIYEPFFGDMNLSCNVVYQEKYGLGEPTDVMVESVFQDIHKDYNRVIGIGGGTVLDISKLFALQDISSVDKLYNGKTQIKKEKELILVPTTCGTGSEMTNISILSLTKQGTKKGLASDEMFADHAVLIPELLKNLPFKFFAASSIDALIHAVESSLSPKGNKYTKLFGYNAIEIIIKGFQKIQKYGTEEIKSLYKDFLIASNYAGIAFGNAGCAAVHALSYPLGAKYHVAHGESNYAVFTAVMKKYMEKKQDGEILQLNNFLSELLDCNIDSVYQKLEDLLNVVIQKKNLHEYGMSKEDIVEFTESVINNQQRLLNNNFVSLSKQDINDIYKSLY